MPRRLILTVLLGSVLLAAPTVAGHAADAQIQPSGESSRIDAIRQRGVLRVAVLDEYPWLIRDAEGSTAPFHGPAWRLAEEYAHRLGVRIETTAVSFDDKVSILTGGSVDISIVPLLDTPERDRIVDTILYSMAAQCLFGLADNTKVSGTASVDALDRPDVTIAFITDTPQGAWLQGRLPRAKRDGVPGNITSVAVDEITSRRADVAPIDKFFFADLARRVPGLVSIPKACLASDELPIPIGMAVDKGQPAFVAWLRAVAAAVQPEVDAEMATVIKEGR